MTRKERKTITEETVSTVLAMHRTGNYTIQKIAALLQMHRHTASKIIENSEKQMPFISAGKKRSETCAAKNATYSNVDQTIYNAINLNNSLTLKEVKEKVLEICNVSISGSSVHRKLRSMNITRKRLTLVPIERNTADRLDARALYASDLTRIANSNLIFLDETGFNEHTQRKYGYSPRNSKAYITVPANRNTNKSLICAVSVSGVVGYEIRTGAYTSESFINVLRSQILQHFQQHPNNILIMDNARIHKTESVLQFLRENNILYKYLVPYSPELNPIEEFFSMFKSRFSNTRLTSPQLSVVECINKTFEDSDGFAAQCENFYAHMREWLEKARRKEPFI